jgi:hypothetical protein
MKIECDGRGFILFVVRIEFELFTPWSASCVHLIGEGTIVVYWMSD